jgi:hypothetical protein
MAKAKTNKIEKILINQLTSDEKNTRWWISPTLKMGITTTIMSKINKMLMSISYLDESNFSNDGNMMMIMARPKKG